MQHLSVRPHPLAPPVVVELPPGLSIRGMLQHAAGNRPLREGLHVQVDGRDVPEAYWDRLHPRTGARIVVSAPTATNGGNTKQVLAAAVMIVVSIYAPGWGSAMAKAAGWSATAGKFIAAGIMLGASLAVSALVAPHSSTDSSSGNSWRQLTGTANGYNQWGRIPCVIGQMRWYPPHAALPYSEQLGEKSYHYYLFELGYGDIEVSDIRIGETSIDEYDEVEYHVTTSPTLYKNDVDEQTLGLTMDDEGDVNVRTTSPNTERITVVLLYANGLYGVGTSGKSFELNTIWDIQYRETGSSEWKPLPSPTLSGLAPFATRYNASALNKNGFSVAVSWDVPAGQYDVRVERAYNPRGSSKNTYVDTAQWAILRSLKYVDATTTGTNKLEMRILATDQLNSSLDSLSLLQGQKIKAWDDEAEGWADAAIVTNAAWVVYWLLTECPALAKHVPESRMLLDNWRAYARFCDAHGLEARDVLDSATTVRDYADKLLASALGALGHTGMHYHVVYDDFDDDSVPSWTFLPLEVTNFQSVRTFTELPHALRVQFVNAENDYIDDEVIVLADGYSYRGVDARGNPSSGPEPTKYETLKMETACTPQQAWRYGRFHLAQGKYRPETLTWDSDIAGFGARRGNLVNVGTHVVNWGVGFGTIERFAFCAWSSLSGMTAPVGQRVPVMIDTGTHTDPVTGDTVPNAGVYQRTSAGWRWLRALQAGEGLDTVPDGTLAVVWLDHELRTDPAETYRLQIRNGRGQLDTCACLPHAGTGAVFYLTQLPTGVGVGHYCALGTSTEATVRVLLTGRTHSAPLATSFSGVRYDSRVKPYWQDPPATIISEVTGEGYGTPATPTVVSVVSTAASDGTDDAGIRTATVRITPSTSSWSALEAA